MSDQYFFNNDILYIHNGILIPCPKPSMDLMHRIFKSVHGKGHKKGGLNKTDIWLVLEMTARRGHIDFKGRIRGGSLGMKRKSGQLRYTLRQKMSDVTISWMNVVNGTAESCESCGLAV